MLIVRNNTKVNGVELGHICGLVIKPDTNIMWYSTNSDSIFDAEAELDRVEYSNDDAFNNLKEGVWEILGNNGIAEAKMRANV